MKLPDKLAAKREDCYKAAEKRGYRSKDGSYSGFIDNFSEGYVDGFNAGAAEVLAIAEKLAEALKAECCCTGERDYLKGNFIKCDACEALANWEAWKCTLKADNCTPATYNTHPPVEDGSDESW